VRLGAAQHKDKITVMLIGIESKPKIVWHI